MSNSPHLDRVFTGILLMLLSGVVQAEWSGYFGVELKGFTQDAQVSKQDYESNISLVAEPEYYHCWSDCKNSLTFTPFVRLDENDSERTHFDIRELMGLWVKDDIEIRAGIGKVFWGVTESVHLVDVINQTDLVENIDGEDKLGQPMINVSWIQDWGTIDAFVLPGFRERTFAGIDGRLRSTLRVDTDHPIYHSGAEEWYTDVALRWSHTLGDWDFGVAHFRGTSRDPRFVAGVTSSLEPVLIPVYDLVNQTSLDLQATKGDWLWKLEVMTRSGQGDRFTAAVGGFEYTLTGMNESSMDLGILVEYLFDDRNNSALTPVQNDVFAGVRLTLNDAESTELLAGIIQDVDSDARFMNMEFSRRIGNNLKLEVEGRFFSHIPAMDASFGFRTDDYIQVELTRHF